jgi:hypothetical protein
MLSGARLSSEESASLEPGSIGQTRRGYARPFFVTFLCGNDKETGPPGGKTR